MELWKKIIVRLGMPLITRPPKKILREYGGESLMAAHYCRMFKTYSYAVVHDYLSKNEYFWCKNCGRRTYTECLFGFTPFFICEVIRISKEQKFGIMRTFFLGCGFGLRDLLPDDRGGKTAGQLESMSHSLVKIYLHHIATHK